MNPKDVWVVLAVSVTVLEGDLALPHAAEPGDSNTAAFAVIGVVEQDTERSEYILATYEAVVSCLWQVDDGVGRRPLFVHDFCDGWRKVGLSVVSLEKCAGG